MDKDSFAYFEDVDLAWRLCLSIWKSYYFPNFFVYHKFSASGGKVKEYFLSRNLPYYIKNASIKTLLIGLGRILYDTPVFLIFPGNVPGKHPPNCVVRKFRIKGKIDTIKYFPQC
ncbi:hypothetical protein KAU33_13360 [Candidatus Dependentiae bacterium]|nr:hypothetical protein [Candidatus Dependentiae bacterium]